MPDFEWFVTLGPRDWPHVRLFCFPHAGGSAAAYASWPNTLPDTIEVVAVQPPGRASRLGQPLPVDLDAMASAIADGIQQQSDVPFAFFGHSFGSLIAYEVARKLEDRGLPGPLMLIASAHSAPHLHAPSPSSWLHELTEEEFVARSLAHGYIPQEAAGNTELLAVLSPVLRADLRLEEIYTTQTARAFKTCTVLAFGGSEDGTVDMASLAAWSTLSSTTGQQPEFASMRLFSGGHFYVDTNSEVLPSIEACLMAVLKERPKSATYGVPEARFLADPSTAKCVHVLFDEQAARTPSAVAIVDLHRQLTYSELKQESDLLARHLQRLGITKGDIVGSYTPHRAEYIIANLAIFKAGGAIFPLETNYPADLLAELIQMAGISVVLTMSSMKPMLPLSHQSDGHCFCLEGEWAQVLNESDLPGLNDPQVGLSDRAYVTMTSGSTGRPKGVVNAHIGATHNFLSRFDLTPYNPGEREGLNVFFVWECFRPILQGATAYIIPDEVIVDPRALVNFLHENKVTRLQTTTQLIEAVLEHPGLDLATKLKNIRYWYQCGEPVPARVVAKWTDVLGKQHRLVNCYGSWEALDHSVAFLDSPIQSGSKFAPVGLPLPSVNIYVVDEDLRLLPSGCPGEMLIEAPGLAIEYLHDPEKTAQRFFYVDMEGRRVRVYRTGDRGRVLPTGELECMGRIDSTVKIRGFKVSVPFVESTLKEHPLVRTAAVIPQMDNRTNIATALAAYVVGTNGMMSDAHLEELQSDLKTQLPAYAFPQHWIRLEKLPTKGGESRKLDRQALPPVDATSTRHTGSAGTHSSATSRMEEVILECWTTVLGNAELSCQDNFFEVGGHSLLAAKLVGELNSTYGIAAHVLDIYDHPTVASLAQHLGGSPAGKEQDVAENSRGAQRRNNKGESKIAVIGLGGRFPGAMDVGEFWENLKAGHDSLRRFTPAELETSGVPANVYNHPDYVLAGQVCDDVDKFDAAFWGIGKLEAEIMDPQHRVFMEVAWHAIEDSGYPPRTGTQSRCGVFAACGIDGYLVHHLNGGALKHPMDPGSLFLTEVASEKDYIATRVAYALDLKGPSIVIQSACSSGLVAIAQAAQSMASNACDMAIAGASSLTFPNTGFLFDENLVYSRDGHVRPFDRGANGTTFGDSVGAVVLKVLEDSVEDNDRIYAVLCGSAVTNDGAVKAGYTAPAAAGQSAAIVAAHQAAQVDPRDISYVECHATATNIGDAIEVRGLTDAFSKSTSTRDPQFCALGSVKGNIGHANCAAGLTGLVKTVLCLHHRQLVPTAHFSQLSDKIPIRSNSPFYVHKGLTSWVPDGQQVRAPLRAGVSSFGIGGTNAHAILQEWSPEDTTLKLRETTSRFRRSIQVLTLSAKSVQSLSDQLLRLADFAGNPVTDLADTAYTLQLGREEFAHRAAIVCNIDDHKSAEDALRKYTIGSKSKANPGVVLCFPGQGSQYINMGRGLYDTEETYRKHFDACVELLEPIVGVDIRAELFFDGDEIQKQAKSLSFSSKPEVVQTSIFTVEYALAKLLIEKLGIQPIAMVGHSIGEYAAACVAGVLKLEDALGLVATRAIAMGDTCERGCMLSAKMPPADARSYVSERSDVWIACENSPENVVLSCTANSAQAVSDELDARGIKVISLPVTHGFHSEMVRPAADAVAKFAVDIEMQSPSIPMTSNVTGTWLPQELSPNYWAEHIVKTVRFGENIETVAKWKPTIFVECGPGTTLCTLIDKSFASVSDKPLTLPAMRHPKDTSSSDEVVFASMVANLWIQGISIDWSALHRGEHIARCSVPGYSFERVSHWKHPDKSIYVTPNNAAKKRKHKQKEQHRKPNASKITTSLVRYGNHALAATTVVYCFTYAGGSSLAFANWARCSPAWLDVVAIELPGRGSRSVEPRPASHAGDKQLLAEIAADIQKDAESSKVKAIAFAGLSMGCLTAIEVQNLLRDLPVAHTFLAGRAPPQIEPAESVDQSTIAKLNLAPAEIQNSDEWTSHFLPMLVADLEADMRAANRVATFLTPELVRGDVEVFCGLEDPSFPTVLVQQWQACTHGHFDQHFFVGGHDFLKNCAAQIFRRIENTLCASLPQTHVGQQLGAPSSHSNLLSKVSWERPPTRSAQDDTQEEMFVLKLGHEEKPFTEAQLNAVHTAAGLVVVLATESYQEEAPATPPTADRSEYESSWVTDDQTQCMQLLQLVNRLVDIGAGGGKLTLVCDTSLRGAMAVGASKAIPLEFPEFFVQRIFIQKDTSGVRPIEQAVRAAAPYATETDVLVSFDRWRNEPSVRVARLQPLSQVALPVDASRVRLLASNAAYIVTGGLGGVGAAVVDWLIEVQHVAPHNIFIVSRRELDQPHKHRDINVLQADVSDLSSLLANEALNQLSDIGGIFHLAGVLDDGLIGQMTLPRLAKCSAPKVTGAINLIRLAEKMRWHPEFMLCFSSTSSLAGYAAQANYCAANQVLDHLGQGWSRPFRANIDSIGRGPEMKMITVNWGAWGEAGMAAVGTKAHQLSLEQGQVPLSTHQGLHCLAGILLRALGTDAPVAHQFAACSCEWSRTPWAGLPLISHVDNKTAVASASAGAATHSREGDDHASDSSDSGEDDADLLGDTRSAVVIFLEERVPRWDTTEPLAALGLDSLDLVSMRNNYNKQFGKQLGLQLFTNPQKTLGELLDELESACQ